MTIGTVIDCALLGQTARSSWLLGAGLPRWKKRSANVVFTCVLLERLGRIARIPARQGDIRTSGPSACISTLGVPLPAGTCPAGYYCTGAGHSPKQLSKYNIEITVFVQTRYSNKCVPKLAFWHRNPVIRVRGVHDMPERRVLPELRHPNVSLCPVEATTKPADGRSWRVHKSECCTICLAVGRTARTRHRYALRVLPKQRIMS